MSNRTELINSLFNNWENEIPEYKNKFVKDGILNEDLYNTAKHKILFITKEPNNPKQESGDFREWWKDELYYTFSYRIAEWSYGILNDFPEYDIIWKTNGLAHNAIQHISLMNIKKNGGGGNSEYLRMMEHAKMNYKFLQRQLEIISPEVIILGTSWKELRNEVLPNITWKDSGYGIDIGRYGESKVIDFYHPSSRNAPAATYCLLQKIIESKSYCNL